MTLNAERKVSNGSECQTKQNMAPNVGMNDVMALNAMQKQKHDSECRNEDVALNAKTKVGKGSERQAKRNIDECQSETKALHAQLNW